MRKYPVTELFPEAEGLAASLGITPERVEYLEFAITSELEANPGQQRLSAVLERITSECEGTNEVAYLCIMLEMTRTTSKFTGATVKSLWEQRARDREELPI